MTSLAQPDAEGQSALKVGPASTGQRLLWVLERSRARRGALNTPIVCRLRGPLNKRAMQEAVTALVARHESLRTRMSWEPPRLVRLVAPDWRPELRTVDLSATHDPAAAVEQELGDEIGQDIPSTEWPVRASVWTLAPDDHVVCVSLNHLSTDSSSSGILLRELGLLYRAGCGEAVEPLPEVVWQYSQWVDWQTSQVNGRRDRFVKYWQQNLKGAVGPKLPPARSPADAEAHTAYESRPLAPGLFDAMLQLAAQERATPFSVVLALSYMALYRQTGQTDLTVTTLLTERNRPQVFSTVGYFINAVPLRTAFSPSDSFLDLLRASRATLFGALQHQTMSFHTLPRTVTHEADVRIDHVVVQMMGLGDAAEFPAPFELWERRPDFGAGSAFDLELVLFPVLGFWCVNVLYATRLFERSLVRGLIEDFCDLAGLAVAEPGSEIRALVGRVVGRRTDPSLRPEDSL